MTAVSPTASTALEVAALTEPDEILALGDEWDALVRGMPRPSPFQLSAWVAEWLRHYPGGDVHAVVARRAGRLVGALPVRVERRRGLRVLGWIGGDLTNFADVLTAHDEPAATAAALCAAVDRIPHDYTLLHGLSAGSTAAEQLGLRVVERVEAPVLDLDGGWDAVYEAKTPPKRRALHRRRRRQLAEVGKVETRVLREPDELAAVLDETFRLHELRWAGRYDGSGYASAVGRRFHRAVLQRLAEQDVARIVTLELDGAVIAFHYYFALAGTMYVHRLAFDPACGRHSPGILNTLDAIAAASEEGLRRVEFMGSADRYKVELSDRFEPMHDGFGAAGTPWGAGAAEAARVAVAARRRLKRSERLRTAYGVARGRLHRGD